MKDDGPGVPPIGAGGGSSRVGPSTDSFKDDIQAIGRAVDRLREGFAGASDASPEPGAGHDSLQWGGALSSSTLGSGAGGLHSLRGPKQAGTSRKPLAKGGSGGSVDQPSIEPSAFDRTSISQGRLSLHELRSADEAHKFYPDARGTELRDEAAPLQFRNKLKTLEPSTHRARSDTPKRSHSSREPGTRAVAVAAPGESNEGRRREITGGLSTQTSADALLAFGGTKQRVPLLRSSSSPLASDIGDGGGGKTRRLDSSSEISNSASLGARSSSGRKRSASNRRRSSRGERQEGEASSKDVVESGPLFELRDALKAREQELSRLKRDVAVVGTSAADFKNLTTSLGSGGRVDSSVGFGAYGNDDDNDRLTASSHAGGDGGGGTSGAGLVRDDAAPSVAGTRRKDAALRSYSEKGELSRRSSETPFGSTKTPGASVLEEGESAASRWRVQPPQQTMVAPKGAVEVVGGSPLVASAHEGLRKMRLVLEQRARDAGHAKDDASNLADRVNDLSARLRRSERKRGAQAVELAESRAEADAARSELSRLARAREAADANDSDERAALRLSLRERDGQIAGLREKLETATGELSEEQEGVAALRSRLEASGRELREAGERAAVAEENAAARAASADSAEALRERIAELEDALEERDAEAERARAEVRSSAAGSKSMEEEGRRQAREATRARGQLAAERDASARVHLELEAAIRERTQAVEKLAIAEAESGRLHVELAAALVNAQEHQAVRRECEQATERLSAAETELRNLRVTLALAREGQQTERGRFERECRRVAELENELEASEARQEAQKDEISLVRRQVSQLDAKIQGDRSRGQADAHGGAAKRKLAEVEREAAVLRTSLHHAGADLCEARERERKAAESAADLKAELLVSRDGLQRAEAALATALERALAAEAAASRARGTAAAIEEASKAAEITRRDKDTLKRGLTAAQAQAAEFRAENSRLVAELERGGAGGLGGAARAVAKAAEEAALKASEAAADTAASSALRIRAELEDRLALAVAGATEARAEAQWLKSKVTTYEREYKMTPPRAKNGKRGAGRGQEAISGVQRDKNNTADRLDSARARGLLREACGVMGRVATALSAAADRTDANAGGGGSELDDPRWAIGKRRGRLAGGRNRAVAAAATTTSGYRRKRAASADSSTGGDLLETDDDNLGGDAWGARSEGDRSFVSRAELRDAFESLRFEAARLLTVRRDEWKAAGERVGRLQDDLRNSQARETETAARLEESRELSREQTSFVEGVWQERRRLEAELITRREEVERLRASEDAARTTVPILEGRVEDLSTALRQGQKRAKRDAEAEVAAEARDAMDALRRQLNDLRREVERTKHEQATRSGGPPPAAGAVRGASESSGAAPKEREGEAQTQGGGVAATGATAASAVLEGEFQRLRAKYEKAKGRIAALEELVTVSRRVSAQARKEFQGALDTLKLSQELLLKIHAQRQRADDSGDARIGPKASPAAAEKNGGVARGSSERAPAAAPPVEDGNAATAGGVSLTDAHVRELAAQASRMRGMSGNVQRLLLLAAGEVQGALEDTRESFGLTTADTGHERRGSSNSKVTPAAVAAVGTQTGHDSDLERERIDDLLEELRGAEAATRALEVDKARLDAELGRAVEELAGVQRLLREKTAQALVLEAHVTRSEVDRREAREAEASADIRLAKAETAGEMIRRNLEAAEMEISDTRGRLDTALVEQRELRERCEELVLSSGAFAAEVAKQKEESAKSQEWSRQDAAAGAAELRERCAELEASAAERRRLEEELASARAEAQQIDADVAQVLDALATSDMERRRLEGELERQSSIAAAAEGAAVLVRKGVDRERAALCEKADRLEGAAQAGASSAKEPLELEKKRREHLERERKGLISRVTELEGALTSASAEVRKAAKLAAERGARHERDATALKQEAAGLRESFRQATERAADERANWAGEKVAAKTEAAEERRAALAEAERAYQERIAEREEHAAGVRERDQRDGAALRNEVIDMTEALQAETSRASEALARETSLREKAEQEVADLQRRVAELETALERATATARTAGEAARDAANPIFQLQAEMRSVISSLQPEEESKGVSRRHVFDGDEAYSVFSRKMGATTPAAASAAVAVPGVEIDKVFAGRPHVAVGTASEHDLPPGESSHPIDFQRNADVYDEQSGVPHAGGGDENEVGRLGRSDARTSEGGPVTLIHGGGKARVTARISDGSSLPSTESAARARRCRSAEANDSTASPSLAKRTERVAGTADAAAIATPRLFPAQPASTRGSRSASSSTSEAEPPVRSRRPPVDKTATRESCASSACSSSQQQESSIAEPRTVGGALGAQGDEALAEDVSTLLPPAESSSDDDESLSPTTFASGLSSSLVPAPAQPAGAAARGGLVRSRSVVVRDWKAGQREAFSELDRWASSSGVRGS